MKTNKCLFSLILIGTILSGCSFPTSDNNSNNSQVSTTADYSNVEVSFSGVKELNYFKLEKSVSYVIDIDFSNSVYKLSKDEIVFKYDQNYIDVAYSYELNGHIFYSLRALKVTDSFETKHLSIEKINYGFDYRIVNLNYEEHGISFPTSNNYIKNNYQVFYDCIDSLFYHNFNTNYPGISSSTSFLNLYIYREKFSEDGYDLKYADYLLDSSYLPRDINLSGDLSHSFSALYYYDEEQDVSRRASKQKILGLTIQYAILDSTSITNEVINMTYSIFPKENTSSNKVVTALYNNFNQSILPFYKDNKEDFYKFNLNSNPTVSTYCQKEESVDSIYGFFEDTNYYYYTGCSYKRA
jgi:hypothetical protein